MGASRLGLAGVLLVVSAKADEANASACRELGFGPSLYCSGCDKLASVVPEGDTLVDECRGCCAADPEKGVYASATFDVCK